MFRLDAINIFIKWQRQIFCAEYDFIYQLIWYIYITYDLLIQNSNTHYYKHFIKKPNIVVYFAFLVKHNEGNINALAKIKINSEISSLGIETLSRTKNVRTKEAMNHSKHSRLSKQTNLLILIKSV